jgi:hypothetical protein
VNIQKTPILIEIFNEYFPYRDSLPKPKGGITLPQSKTEGKFLIHLLFLGPYSVRVLYNEGNYRSCFENSKRYFS